MLCLSLLLVGTLLGCDSIRSLTDGGKPRARYTPMLTLGEVGPAPRTEILPPGVQRHAVVVVIDTLREDALQRARTPVLDGLVARGAQRTWAWAPSTWTAPSVVSLFTGMSVRQHGWDFPFPRKMEVAEQSYAPLPPVPLLAEVMTEAGFRSTGLYGNRMLGQGLGYGRRFHRWEWGEDEALIRRAVEEIGRWEPGERHFLYLHLMGPHHPLQPGERSRSHWGLKKRDLGRGGALAIPESHEGGPIADTTYYRAYHAVIEDTDERLGELLRALRPVLDQTVLVVTSDHGELLGEHGEMGHKTGVREPLTRVPFLAWNAPLLPAIVPGEVLPAVVTAATGVPHAWPGGLDHAGPLASQREGDLALSPDGRWKAVWDPDGQGEGVAFDLLEDPGEERPISPLPEPLAGLRESWEQGVSAGALQVQEGGMSEAMQQALEELGYLDR